MSERAGKARLRLLVGKVGLDGHDRGAKIIARALRDAGFEVIYTGLHQTPEMVVATAIQEDVDAVALSILSGAHRTLFPRVIQLLRQAKFPVPVFGGGIIPEEDISFLKKAGVRAIFTPGTSTGEVVEWVRGHLSTETGESGGKPARSRPVRKAATPSGRRTKHARLR
jgi:methylmalonyl-CoA mutase cobalamin-binding domain/chain